MNKTNAHRNHLFLLEILLNILLFSILLSVCLQFFSKTYRLTSETTDLHRAVTTCTNAASIFESGDGTLTPLLSQYEHADQKGESVLIYLDQDFLECSKKDAVYSVTVCLLPEDSASSRLSRAQITCYRDSEELYSITACRYMPLTPKDMNGGIS